MLSDLLCQGRGCDKNEGLFVVTEYPVVTEYSDVETWHCHV